MASLYDRPDLYDLPDNEGKDKATKAHWEKVFSGKDIESVLDVSIGTGGLTLPMAELGIRLCGSDLSESMLARCRKKAEEKGMKIDLRASDFRNVSKVFPEPFDCVMSTGNSLAYVNNADVRRALHEMDALVKPGGYLYLDTRNWDKILKERQRFFLYNPIFKDDQRINIIQVWDYPSKESMIFNILYTFEKDAKIIRREEFQEHYFPVSLDLIKDMLNELNYTDLNIMPLPAQAGKFDIEKTHWYCLIAKKGGL